MDYITIIVDGRKYRVPYGGGDSPSFIKLPDGRVLRCLEWVETYPPRLAKFEFLDVADAYE